MVEKGAWGLLTWANCLVELFCQEVLVDGLQDLQGQMHSTLFPIVVEQQSGQLHWLSCLELTPGYPGWHLLQADVLQLELELLKVIGHQLFQGEQQVVSRGLGHSVDRERLVPAVWLLGEEKALCPGTQSMSETRQLVK